MSFRGRLTLFFAIIVIVPMVAIGLVLFSLVSSSEDGKSDAQLATTLRVAASQYNDGQARARDDLTRAGVDSQLTRALQRGDAAGATARLGVLVRQDPAIVSATLRPAGAGQVRVAGSRRGVAFAEARLRARGGAYLGTLTVSDTDGQRLADSVRRRTGVDLVIARNGGRVAASRGAPARLPSSLGDFDAAGRPFRGRRERVDRSQGSVVDLAATVSRGSVDRRVSKSRLLIGIVLIGFILLALLSSIYVIRSLQGQIAQFLAAAKRLAGGDFDQPIPTDGNDEFAQLGREFNRMSDQLRSKVEEVDRRRRQTEKTIQRVGIAFASGLDSQAVVELAVQTAVDACAAQAGHAVPLDLHVFERVAAGRDDPAQVAARRQAERAALAARPEIAHELAATRDPRDAAVDQLASHRASQDGAHALAQPLVARLGARTSARLIGVISISRTDVPFTSAEVELLSYLASQAVVSVENADLHETAQQRAITDELTGLANVREMNEALDREFQRGQRFEVPVGFMLLDIDDFKVINDTHGHQQGDRVLSELGTLMRDLSRDIDQPARYGGEELAVVLPQTDIDGAEQLAERMRQRIAAMRIPLIWDPTRSVAVTASFGVASVSSAGSERTSLVAAADAALYRAKRAGKNRVERAGPSDALPRGVGPALRDAPGDEHSRDR